MAASFPAILSTRTTSAGPLSKGTTTPGPVPPAALATGPSATCSPSPGTLGDPPTPLLGALPAYNQTLEAVGTLGAGASPFPPARAWRVVATERGRRAAGRLWAALEGSGLGSEPGLGATLDALCVEEREALAALLAGVPGAAPGPSGKPRSPEKAKKRWTGWSAACAAGAGAGPGTEGSAGSWGPWGAATARPLLRGPPTPPPGVFCCSCAPRSGQRCGTGPAPTVGPERPPPGPRPPSSQGSPPARLRTLAHLRSTLQTAALWLLGQTQRHVSGWAPGPLLLLTHGDLPLLLAEAEGLEALLQATAGGDPGARLAQEIRTLVGRLQVLPAEWPPLFARECGRRATEALRAQAPRGPSRTLRLCLGPPRGAGEGAAREVLGPVLRGLRGLPAPAQRAAFGLALTAFLGAWLDLVRASRSPFSTRLRRDLGALHELLERTRGLPPDLGRALLALGILRGLEGAPGLGPVPPAAEDPQGESPCCCARIRARRPPDASHRGLDGLPVPSRASPVPAALPWTLRGKARGRTGPAAYAPGDQQPCPAPAPTPHPPSPV
ncbi:coiled-coil domain-containing protein 142 [Tachyglossus aculeatus]|uniref:coiled-coil domain-containing protein 142 n=1 Tax=Tachyglossus aculeatus TaxID=9261 RepID=UPI0018F5AD51|nr:coiled-coil domain-containing protein 142 [Tachyglossus aculeatus]